MFNIILLFHFFFFFLYYSDLILDGNEEASRLLAKAVHQKGQCPPLPREKLIVDIAPDECGVWIDPIGLWGESRRKLSTKNKTLLST